MTGAQTVITWPGASYWSVQGNNGFWLAEGGDMSIVDRTSVWCLFSDNVCHDLLSPHYLTRVVTPANQCVITVIIVIMFLQTRYTWRHTRPHLMTITASFLQQMILVRRYFNQIISSYPLPSLNNITSIMWPPSHSKETISSHIVIKSNIELSSSSNILKGKA